MDVGDSVRITEDTLSARRGEEGVVIGFYRHPDEETALLALKSRTVQVPVGKLQLLSVDDAAAA